MKHRRPLTTALALAASAGLGYALRAARAEGIPTSHALSYVGIVEDGTGPITGMHNVQIYLYDAGTAGRVLCQTAAAPFSFVAGRLRVQLPDACTSAVASNPAAWVDVLVDGSDTGRSAIGAVPYAVEANHAVNATTAATATAAGGALAAEVNGLLGRIDLKVFAKTGNNGTVSCDTYCAGSSWGQVGTCVAANLNGAYISCATNLNIIDASIGKCWCSAP
jgi:hypothetical protein